MNDFRSIPCDRPQGLLTIDQTGSIAYCNEAAAQMLGKNKDEILNRQFDEVFQNLDFGFTFRDAIEGRAITPSKMKGKVPNGKILEVEPTLVPDKSLIILIRDVTRHRRLEQISERKRRLEDLGELASTISHEIRNPLGGIKGFASLLENDLQDDPKKLRMAQNIIKGANDLNNILTRLLEYTQPPSLKRKNTAIQPLILEAVDQIQIAAVTLDLPKQPVMAFVDPALIRQTLVNLLLNAAQAIDKQGTITISLTETDINIRIVIEDIGCGIEEGDLKKIFRPYFSTKSEASGFGLAEVKKTVDAHQGEIEVESEVGKGSKFTVIIPRDHEN